MGFFSNLFRSRTKSSPSAVTPAGFEVAPGLTVQVVCHQVAPTETALWSFITDGLRAHGQREIVFTLVRRRHDRDDEFPGQVLSLFKLIDQLARQGRIVVPGQLTEFGPKGFLEPHLRAIIYTEAQPLDGVRIPDDALAAILIDGEELDVVKRCGAYRVLARLGQQHSLFPFPPWTDRDRDSVARGHDETRSVLHEIGSWVMLADVSLVLDQQRLCLQIPRPSGPEVAAQLEQFPPDVAFSIILQPAYNAHAWLLWLPGQTETAAITGPNPSASPLAGGFLAIVPSVDVAEQVLLIEDGFSLVLRADTWATCKRAIASGAPFTLPAAEPGGLSFELAWIDEDYRNPIDGTTIHAPGGWHLHMPAGGITNDRSQIRLLTGEREMAAAITVPALTGYLNQIVECVERVAPSSIAKTTATLQVELAPDREPTLQFHFEPSAPLETQLRDALTSLTAPAVRGPIAFQVVLRLGSDA